MRETIEIAAPPDTVWPHIADPEKMRRWNPKIVAISRSPSGPVEAGETFWMTYRMRERQVQAAVEVVAAEPGAALSLEVRPSTRRRRSGPIYESYALTERDGRTRVVRDIDVSKSRLPLPVRILMALLSRFGKPTETPYLARLKEIVEGGDAAQ